VVKNPVITDTLIPVLAPGTNGRLARSMYGSKPLMAPALTEGVVQDLSAGIAYVFQTGCTYRQVWKHRRNLAPNWPVLLQRRGLLKLLHAKREMDGAPADRSKQVTFLQLLVETRVGIDRKELVSLGWGRELLGQEVAIIATDPEPLTFQEADLFIEACLMLAKTRGTSAQSQVPVQDSRKIAAVAEAWLHTSAIDRQLVHDAWWWWRGFAPLYSNWVEDMQALFVVSGLAYAIANEWGEGFRDPFAKPAPASRPGPTGAASRPNVSGYGGRGYRAPSPYSSMIVSQDYAPRLTNYNGGWFPANSPVVPIFGQ
jgi:hypothetical protein